MNASTSKGIEFDLDDSSSSDEQNSMTSNIELTPRPSNAQQQSNDESSSPIKRAITLRRPNTYSSSPSKLRATLLRARQTAAKTSSLASKFSKLSNSSPLYSRLYGKPETPKTYKRKYAAKTLPTDHGNKNLGSRTVGNQILGNQILGSRILPSTDNAFIEKQPKMKFNGKDPISQVYKKYSDSLTAGEIRLKLREMNDDGLLNSLVKNMNDVLEENSELIQALEQMTNDYATLQDKYENETRNLTTLQHCLDASKLTIEQLKAQNKELKQQLSGNTTPSSTNNVTESKETSI